MNDKEQIISELTAKTDKSYAIGQYLKGLGMAYNTICSRFTEFDKCTEKIHERALEVIKLLDEK